ncbi:FAS1-like dehydratase domain-containing protein [Haladaptatus sp. NG-SE-30]
MVGTELEGTELPSGEFEVGGWKAHLWADATRNDEDAFRYEEDAKAAGEPGQLVPYSMCHHIVVEATDGVDAMMNRITDKWTAGAALGGLRVDFHAPLQSGETLRVEGRVDDVVEKEGKSGRLTIVTHAYSVTSPTGDPVYDLEADIVVLGDD